jgi:hypothetical protein
MQGRSERCGNSSSSLLIGQSAMRESTSRNRLLRCFSVGTTRDSRDKPVDIAFEGTRGALQAAFSAP